MTLLSIRLLGAFAVTYHEQPVTTFRSLKNGALLAYLAVEAARPHTRAALAGLLWPEQPETEAFLNLRQALFRLRKLLANDTANPPFLQITQTSVQFVQQSDHWLDATAFVHLLAACENHAHTVPAESRAQHRRHCRPCMERLAQAVALYQGEFMHGIYIDDSPALEEWLLLRREGFQQQALVALYELAAWHEEQGDYGQAYTYARRQLDFDSLHEESHRQLMRILALDGKRSAALAHYEACCAILDQELGVPPAPETVALVHQIEAGELTPVGAATKGPQTAPDQTAPRSVGHNLPSLGAAFIGREAEVARLREQLLNPAQRLVTLVGPGGVGKTRLALAAAADLVGAFTDGVWFVALAGVEDENGLVAALAAALGFMFQGAGEPQQQLLAYLHNREALLILDNFEQLMAVAPFVQQLVERAPRLKVLVTSRERLDFQSELTFAVTGLAVPSLTTIPTANARAYSSVQLFCERAQRSPLGFTVDDETVPAVVEICQLVEGLPLALELAASWTDHYSCREIAQAIAATLDFLSTAQRDRPLRQRSLRAVFDCSWRLLSAAEQTALAQMTVLRGAFSRTAAQAVTGVALPLLTALVNKSLVRSVGPGRYALHELVRQFAAEALTEPPDAHSRQQVEERHAAYYLQWVGKQEGLFGQSPQKAVTEITQELDNVRQAWRWAVSQRATASLAAAVTNLARVYDLAGLYREALTLWQSALERWQPTVGAGDAPIPPEERFLLGQLYLAEARSYAVLGQSTAARNSAAVALHQARQADAAAWSGRVQSAALQQLGLARYRLGEHAAALPLLAEAVSMAQTTHDARLTADCLLSLGEVYMYQGEAAGRASVDQALTLYRAAGDRRGEGAALQSLGNVALMQSDFDKSKEYLEQALRIHRSLGDRHSEAMTLNAFAGLYSKQGNYPESDQMTRQSLHLARQLGYRIGEVQALTSLGVNQMAQRQPGAARAHFEEALPLARQSGYLRGEGALLNNLGNLASDEQAYAQAEAFYQAALTVAHQSGDRYYVCGRLHNLGNMRRFQGDYVGAQHYYAEAVTIAAAIGDRWIEGSARSDLALTSLFLCDEVAAGQHCRQALFLARAIGDRWCECKVLATLGWLAVLQHHDPAGLATIEKAIHLAQEAKEMGVEGAAQARRGFALLTLAQPTAAVAAFERSIVLRQQTGDRVQIVTPLAGLAAAYWAIGEVAHAQSQVEVILRTIGDRPLGIADDPRRVYGACLQVLQTVGDDRAATILPRARTHLAEQADRLTNARQRLRFIQQCEEALGDLLLPAG